MSRIFDRTAYFLIVLSLSAPLLRADVLVVDETGGGDFTDIQPAVDAANDGDVVLVKSGTYPFFTISHKGVSIVADSGAQVAVQGIRVQNTLVDHVVVLAGLESYGAKLAVDDYWEALALDTTRGPVRVESCTLVGPDGIWHLEYYDTSNAGEDAVRAFLALDVSFTRCTMTGGNGEPDTLALPEIANGGDGLQAEGCSIAIHDSILRGGDGANNFDQDLSHGGIGGHGAVVRDHPLLASLLHASGSTFHGGAGGSAALCLDLPGNGGHGLWLDGPTTTAHLIDDLLEGGLGSDCGGIESEDGEPLRVTNGAVANMMSGETRRLQGVTPVREGTVATLSFTGRPNDRVHLMVGAEPGFRLVLAYNGVVLLRTPALQQYRFVRTIPAGGRLNVPLAVPALPPLIEARNFYLQGLFQDPTTRRWLSGPSTLVVLDGSF